VEGSEVVHLLAQTLTPKNVDGRCRPATGEPAHGLRRPRGGPHQRDARCCCPPPLPPAGRQRGWGREPRAPRGILLALGGQRRRLARSGPDAEVIKAGRPNGTSWCWQASWAAQHSGSVAGTDRPGAKERLIERRLPWRSRVSLAVPTVGASAQAFLLAADRYRRTRWQPTRIAG
jgi:hypothetical protein